MRGPVVTQIYTWRVNDKLAITTIVARLNADPAAYPTPDGRPGWTKPGVTKILANPKYTGHMVYGRTRTTQAGRARPVPADQWIWSPAPTHPAIIDRATWNAAQKTGAERGNVRDAEMPTTRQGRRYILRSRIRCRICQRRMCGTWRTSANGITYIYYRCPHDPANPRHRAAHPDHGPVSVSEHNLMTALTGFFDQYVFGHDRAALLASQLPATAAGHAENQARQVAHLRAELVRIDTAERALISELEQPADPGDPAGQAYRARIPARYAELYEERAKTEAQLTALESAAAPAGDMALLDALPTAAHVLADAPSRIKEAILAAFDIQALYNNDMNQVTIWATLTDNTPGTIAALLNDPRTDDDTPAPARNGTVSHLGSGPIAPGTADKRWPYDDLRRSLTR